MGGNFKKWAEPKSQLSAVEACCACGGGSTGTHGKDGTESPVGKVKKGKGAVDSEEGVKNWLKRFDKDSCEEMTDALSEAEALDIMNDKLCPQMIDVLTKCIQGCQYMNFR